MSRPVAAPNPLSTRPFHLLVVCTANQARSPLGEVIARDALTRRGIDGWVTLRRILIREAPRPRPTPSTWRATGA